MSNHEPYRLTAREMELVCNEEWLLLKHGIIDKVYRLFGALQQELESLPALSRFPLPAECLKKGAKISRGENYGRLPYVILDFPRHFSRESIFAYRVMFRWGHDFTFTLHLGGDALREFMPALTAGFGRLKQHNFWVSTGTDPWVHHLATEHFRPLQEMTEAAWQPFLEKRAFIKISKKTGLHQWTEVIPEGTDALETLLEVLHREVL